MKPIECADYDSMGNHGRFPAKKAKMQKSILDSILDWIREGDGHKEKQK